jgi:hypothetical protein
MENILPAAVQLDAKTHLPQVKYLKNKTNLMI